MNNEQKKWIVLLVIVVIIAIILITVLIVNRGQNNQTIGDNNEQQTVVNEEKYVTTLENGIRLNTSEEFNSVKKYKDLEISNIQFTEEDGNTIFLADVKNAGNIKHENEIVKITILGENDEIITEIKPVIEAVEPGKTVKINAIISADVVNAKDFKIEEVK